MRFKNNNHTEKRILEFSEHLSGRRNFIKGILALAATSQFGLLQSCVKEYIPTSKVLNKKQYNILISIQNILFPKDELGAGAFDFDSHEYLLWVLSDRRIDMDDQKYIINGIAWVNETAQEQLSKDYLDLSESERKILIKNISTLRWGESWLAIILNYIFEAMISDPVYGYNKEEIGWKWLDYQAGYPRPNKELLYDKIFKTVQENT